MKSSESNKTSKRFVSHELEAKLLNTRETLDREEIGTLVDFIQSNSVVDGFNAVETDSVRLTCALALYHGFSIKAALKLQIKSDKEFKPADSYIDLIQNCLMLKSAYPGNINQRHKQRESQGFLKLRLNKEVVRLIVKLMNNRSASVMQQLDIISKKTEHLASKLALFLSLNTKPTKITINRARNTLKHTIYSKCLDHVQIAYLIPDLVDGDEFVWQGLHYTSLSIAQLQRLYMNAHKSLFSDDAFYPFELDKPESRIGSVNYPELETVSKCIGTARQKISRAKRKTFSEDLKGQKNFEEFHNLFTLYTICLLNYSTTHRAVKDPYYSEGCFIEMRDGVTCCQVTDKVLKLGWEGRITFLSAVAIEQLEQYQKYHARLLQERPELLSDSEKVGLPFFFMVVNGKTQRIGASEITDFYQNLGFSMPANVHRHVFASKMTENRLSRNLISTVMGHIISKQEFFSSTSTLDTLTLGSLVIPALDKLFDELELKAVKAPASNKSFGCLSKIDHKPWLMGPYSRQQKQRKSTKRKQNLE